VPACDAKTRYLQKPYSPTTLGRLVRQILGAWIETMPSGLHWNEFELLTFDCYGTLVDWETGILGVLKPWASANAVGASSEELPVAFGAAESVVQRESPQALYRDVLRKAMGRIVASFGKTAHTEEREALASSVGDWPVFADTVEALRALKTWHKLMVVSNVDKESFARTAPKLGVALDGFVSAEEVGAYKPDRRMFDRAMAVARDWGIPPQRILHVAQSVFHDIGPAKTLGLRTVWVDRRGGRPGGATPKPSGDATPDLRVTSLAELVALERADRRA
jgi:2-haloacid dehalogenase